MSLLLAGIMRKYEIRHVWHFTDAANVESIKQCGGILSLRELGRRGVEIPMPGGDDLSHKIDIEKGLDRYTRLCFKPKHPMEFRAREQGRITNTVWIKIKSNVICNPEARFSVGVAYKGGVEIIDHERAAVEIDFEVLYTWMVWNDAGIQDRRQLGGKSEILIPDMIPIEEVMGFY